MCKFVTGDTVQLKKDISEKRLFPMLRIRETFGNDPLKVISSSDEYNEITYLVTNYAAAAWVKEEWIESYNGAKISITPEDLMAIL